MIYSALTNVGCCAKRVSAASKDGVVACTGEIVVFYRSFY